MVPANRDPTDTLSVGGDKAPMGVDSGGLPLVFSLPVSSFDGQRLEVASGDLLVVATDGILEVCNKLQEEFGVERLKQVIAANAKYPLPELAVRILAAARGFGH